MVTGVETASLVLAAAPLLILALEKWHGGFVKTRTILGLRRKDRERLAAKIKGLVTELTWHDLQLSINLKTLLLAADAELNIEDLPRDYRDGLWSGSLGGKVDDYLRRIGGEDAVKGFRERIDSSKLLVEEIAEGFEHAGWGSQIKKRDLKTLCDIFSQPANKLPLSRRFGFTLHEKDIDRLAEKLGSVARSISSFVADASDLDTLMARSSSDRSFKQLQKATNLLYKTRRQAFTLFKVLQDCWVQDCQHKGHNVLLHLKTELPRHGTSHSADLHFHVLFQWFGQEEPEPYWMESAVIMNTDSVNLPEPETAPASTPVVQLPPDTNVCSKVTDICHQIGLAHSNNEDVFFHISDDDRLYCAVVTATQVKSRLNRVRILHHTSRLVSLDGYLTSSARKMPDRKRIELGSKLACSILQYTETPWFARGWRKECIYFFEDKMTGAAIDVDHPLILEPFPCTDTTALGGATAPEPRDTLLDLAVILMELYHRTTFEDWMRQQFPNVDLANLADPDWKLVYATKWYKAAMPRDADFRAVVSVCLWPYHLEQYDSTWEDEQFRCAFYKHVISPLLESFVSHFSTRRLCLAAGVEA